MTRGQCGFATPSLCGTSTLDSLPVSRRTNTRFNVDRACCGADVRDNINTAVRHTLRGDLV